MIKIIISLITCVVLWSTNIFLSKELLSDGMNMEDILFYRFLTSFLLCLPICIYYIKRDGGRPLEKIKIQPILVFALFGLIGFNFFLIQSIQLAQPIIVAFALSCTTIVASFTKIKFEARFVRNNFNLILLTFVALIEFISLTFFENNAFGMGILFALIAVVSWSINNKLINKNIGFNDVFLSNTIAFGVAALFFFILYQSQYDIIIPNHRQLLLILYISVFVNVIPNLLWIYFSPHVDYAISSFIFSLIPFVSYIISVTFFNESFLISKTLIVVLIPIHFLLSYMVKTLTKNIGNQKNGQL